MANNNKVIVLKMKLLKVILLSGATETLLAGQLLSVLATPVILNGPATFFENKIPPCQTHGYIGTAGWDSARF